MRKPRLRIKVTPDLKVEVEEIPSTIITCPTCDGHGEIDIATDEDAAN